jgi:uncharacterized protein (DUF433 family)
MATIAKSTIKPTKPLSRKALEGDLIPPGHSLFGLIWINPRRLGGTPCFSGTRVPIQNLFDYLESGHDIDEFLNDFEGVARDQAIGVIDRAHAGLLADLPKA